LREYETTIIVQPEISDDGTAAIFERVDRALSENGSIRLLCENLGKRKLAYEIRKFHKGHYYVLSFLDDGQVIRPFERVLRLNESVLRFMTIQTNPEVTDIEARKVEAAEAEAEQTRKAEERAQREEEEAKARAEVERVAAEEAAAAARKAEAAAAAPDAPAAEAESEAAAESQGAAAAAPSEPAADSGAKPEAKPDTKPDTAEAKDESGKTGESEEKSS